MATLSEQELLQLKFGLAFKKILESNKKETRKNMIQRKELNNIDDSYGKISSSTGLRPASISYIISGKSNMKISTMTLLLEALGKSYTDLGKILDRITENEVLKYKNDLQARENKSNGIKKR